MDVLLSEPNAALVKNLVWKYLLIQSAAYVYKKCSIFTLFVQIEVSAN